MGDTFLSRVLPRKGLEGFLSHIDRRGPDECWIYGGALTGEGYGTFGATNYPFPKLAHRRMWTIFYGPIPEGRFVCHACDNPPCVNPAHLFLGTTQDNTADRHEKGRDARGERINTAKLTEGDVLAIRAEHAVLGLSTTTLGRKYGVSQPMISFIVRRENWTHI